MAWFVIAILVAGQLLTKLRKKEKPEPTISQPVIEDPQVRSIEKHPKARPVGWFSVLGNLAAVVAALAAIAALCINVQEVQQMKAEVVELQRNNRLSAIPRLGFVRVMAPTANYPTPGLYLVNRGQGLAILETYRVYVDGQVVPEGWKFATSMLELDKIPGFRVSTPVETLPGQESSMMWVEFDSTSFTINHQKAFVGALSRLRIEMKYTSVYGGEFVVVLEEYSQY